MRLRPGSPACLTPVSEGKAYVSHGPVIDGDDADVAKLARALAEPGGPPEAVARRCFEWVRDEVLHSSDHRRGPVTCRASETLRHRTGYCYAKSHLLVALLRANGIPSGLVYQRLSLDGEGAPFSLHGLVAVDLPGHGWVRLDPRGNKPGVDAQFQPPMERLAFAAALDGEWDDLAVHAEPLPTVVAALERHERWDALLADLPDA